jgi:hypothetical protein
MTEYKIWGDSDKRTVPEIGEAYQINLGLTSQALVENTKYKLCSDDSSNYC